MRRCNARRLPRLLSYTPTLRLYHRQHLLPKAATHLRGQLQQFRMPPLLQQPAQLQRPALGVSTPPPRPGLKHQNSSPRTCQRQRWSAEGSGRPPAAAASGGTAAPCGSCGSTEWHSSARSNSDISWAGNMSASASSAGKLAQISGLPGPVPLVQHSTIYPTQ